MFALSIFNRLWLASSRFKIIFIHITSRPGVIREFEIIKVYFFCVAQDDKLSICHPSYHKNKGASIAVNKPQEI